MQSIFFGVITVWILWLVFFPRSFGKEARTLWGKVVEGWNATPNSPGRTE